MPVLRFFWRVLHFLFSFRGRFSALQFWAGQLCALVIVFGPILFVQLTRRPLLPEVPEGYALLWVTMGIESPFKQGERPKKTKRIASLVAFVASVVNVGFLDPPEPEPPDADDWGEDEDKEDGEDERVPVN